MKLQGKNITLQPMEISERELLFKWATHSDATPFWHGELYGDSVPTWEEFIKDWNDFYFQDEYPEKGRCFTIRLGDIPIGMICYNQIHKGGITEFDILIASNKHWGKGYGSDALDTLAQYLFENMAVNEIVIAAISNNPRALNSYKKAGFILSEPPEALLDEEYWKKEDSNKWVFLSRKWP